METRAKKVFEILRREDSNEIQWYVLDKKGNVLIQGDDVRIALWIKEHIEEYK